MKKIFAFVISSLFGALLFTGCYSSDQPVAPVPMPPTLTPVNVHSTPAAPGDSVTWRDLQMSMEKAEITDSFITEFGSQRGPSVGQKFLWVQVRLKNVGKIGINIPTPEHFSTLYAKAEFKPTYGHRQGYADYTTLDATLFPGQQMDAWLRFDIPIAADLKNLWFLFLPESAQVGVSPASPNYPWTNGHPTYAWVCVP
jgi:hypothetical protein